MTNKIKALMNLKNKYQIDIAKALGTTQSNISRLINSGDKMRIYELKELVSILGGTVEISIVLPDGTKL